MKKSKFNCGNNILDLQNFYPFILYKASLFMALNSSKHSIHLQFTFMFCV